MSIEAAAGKADIVEIEARFYIDHGVIHDRVTGKHVVTDGEWPFEDDLPRVLDLLNSLTPPQAEIASLRDRVKELEGLGAGALARMMDAQMKIGAYKGYATGSESKAKDMQARAETAERELEAVNLNHRAMATQLADTGRKLAETLKELAAERSRGSYHCD